MYKFRLSISDRLRLAFGANLYSLYDDVESTFYFTTAFSDPFKESLLEHQYPSMIYMNYKTKLRCSISGECFVGIGF